MFKVSLKFRVIPRFLRCIKFLPPPPSLGYHNFLGKANFLGSQEVFFLRMRHFQDIFCGIFSECGTFGKSESRNISESHIKTSWEKSMFSQEVCPKK